MSRMFKSLIVLVAAALVPVFTMTPAQAETCSWSYGGQGYSEQFCSGIHHEYLGSKVYQGTATYVPGTAQFNPALTMSAVVKDKLADGNCAWVRYRVSNVYGTTNDNTPKVCGAGNEKSFNLDLGWKVQNGGTVTFFLCQEGAVGCAASFYQRSF
jgi:hypothetical protein